MKASKEQIIKDFTGLGEMLEIPFTKIYTNDEPLHVCRDTGLVRVKNLRSSMEIAKAWSEEVYKPKFTGNTYTARIPAVRARHIYVADFADTNIGLSGKNVCDIGAGEGQFLEIISKNSYQAKVYGIEPSKRNCTMLNKSGFECFNGTIEEYAESNDFSSNKFDVVTAMWTLVNTSSCLDMVSNAFKMLKTGGHIVIGEGSRILVPFKKPMHYYLQKLALDLHPYHFSANSLQNLLKVVGFEIVHVNRFIDTDYLCIIAKKPEAKINNDYTVDNYEDVISFFERWHLETKNFYSNN